LYKSIHQVFINGERYSYLVCIIIILILVYVYHLILRLRNREIFTKILEKTIYTELDTLN